MATTTLPPSDEIDTDVLIVGAGPTGLMLANQLGRRGVRTLIIDRHAGPARETRALGVQARTLEIYAQLGIVDRALELGKRGTGANVWAEGRKMARVPLGEAGATLTPYPFILILGQDDNERIMGDKLSEWGLTVQWNTELTGLEQDASRVSATLKQPDGSTRKVTAAWVGGCDGARSAARFRDRRCFLLGDAAHIHSPLGAQGMNTGLQDAYNLAWKLALVASGRALPALLDSYEDERIPIARRLLNTTDRAFRLVVSDNPLAGVFRTEILARIAAFGMSREAIQRFAFRTVSQTGIEYRDGPLSKSLESLPDDAPHAGDRFPWLHLKFVAGGSVEDSFGRFDDTHLNLIVIGQPAPGALAVGDLLRIHEIPADPDNEREFARARIPQPSFYLLRPDGYVGLCGARLDVPTVQRYVADRLSITGVGHA